MWGITHLCRLCKHYLLHYTSGSIDIFPDWQLRNLRPAHVQLGLYRWRLWRSLKLFADFLVVMCPPGSNFVRSRKAGQACRICQPKCLSSRVKCARVIKLPPASKALKGPTFYRPQPPHQGQHFCPFRQGPHPGNSCFR